MANVIRARLIAAAVAVALAALAGLGAWLHLRWLNEGAESVRAELQAESDKAAELAREMNRERAATAQRIDANVLTARRAVAPVIASAAADGAGLRFSLAHRGQPAAGADASQCAIERAYSDQLARLLDEGSRLVEESAGIVGPAVALIDGLQAREASR